MTTPASPKGTPSRRGPYAKTAAVRRRILDACLEVFGENGFGASTLKEVATRAGISERGLVHHFGDKVELLTAVLALHEDIPTEEMPAPGSTESIPAVVLAALRTTRRPGLVEMHSTLAAESTAKEHPAHAHYAERYRALRGYLTLAFRTLRAEGRLRSATDPAILASMLIALLDGIQVQWLYDREGVDLASATEAFLTDIGAELGQR